MMSTNLELMDWKKVLESAEEGCRQAKISQIVNDMIINRALAEIAECEKSKK